MDVRKVLHFPALAELSQRATELLQKPTADRRSLKASTGMAGFVAGFRLMSSQEEI